MKKSKAQIVREYGPFPGAERVNGVTYDGSHVWFASGDKLNALDPASGKVDRAIDTASHAGTAFDGKHLWQIADNRIHKIDPKDGRVMSTIPAPGAGASGMAWAEGLMWVGEYRARQIHVVEPETADAEFVSLEDAEDEQQGKKKKGDEAEGDDLDDAAFIEETEEGGDVSVSERLRGSRIVACGRGHLRRDGVCCCTTHARVWRAHGARRAAFASDQYGAERRRATRDLRLGDRIGWRLSRGSGDAIDVVWCRRVGRACVWCSRGVVVGRGAAGVFVSSVASESCRAT